MICCKNDVLCRWRWFSSWLSATLIDMRTRSRMEATNAAEALLVSFIVAVSVELVASGTFSLISALCDDGCRLHFRTIVRLSCSETSKYWFGTIGTVVVWCDCDTLIAGCQCQVSSRSLFSFFRFSDCLWHDVLVGIHDRCQQLLCA